MQSWWCRRCPALGRHSVGTRWNCAELETWPWVEMTNLQRQTTAKNEQRKIIFTRSIRAWKQQTRSTVKCCEPAGSHILQYFFMDIPTVACSFIQVLCRPDNWLEYHLACVSLAISQKYSKDINVLSLAISDGRITTWAAIPFDRGSHKLQSWFVTCAQFASVVCAERFAH